MHSQGTTPDTTAQDMKSTTKHGFLVALGWVAQKLGLREALDRHLHIKQKTYQFKPNDKVIEALVGILGNCAYMKDLNTQAEPITADVAVAKAWGQAGFAHSSTVCATFGKLTTENVAELTKALDEVQGPMLRKEVEALIGPDGQGQVVVDIDLSGQKVRGEAKQYTGTDFGYIKGQLARGYQIVAAFLTGVQDRFAVASTLKSGKAHAQSGGCLLEILPGVEARIGRPLRRTEWVQQCMAEQKARIRQLHQEITGLVGRGSARRRPKLERELKDTVQALTGLNRRLRTYREENATNPAPVRIVLRADSAFGTLEVFQRLLELGYEFAIKSYSGSNPAYKALFDALPADEWVEVGKNRYAAEGIAVPSPQLLGAFPLRLVALRRSDADGRQVRSVVVTTVGSEAKTTNDMVAFYHARQTIGAGFQECKGTFNFAKPRLRKHEANAAFTQLVLFAFNLIRWARPCMQTAAAKIAKAKTRFLVHIAANCRASVKHAAESLHILFSRGTSLDGMRVVVTWPPSYPVSVSNGRMSTCSRET
ncbi:MAG TPA: transposase [Symbiobacteriaceae bacterium]|nr:transposase [Symbiobacteriaceae bacterium]